MASTYRGNFKGIGLMMQRPGIRRVLLVKAAEMVPIAIANSPVGKAPEDKHPGNYARSWRVEYGDKRVSFHGVKRPRPYARLVNKANYAVEIEYGNGKVPRYAVCRKTLDMMKAAHGA